MTKYYRVKKDNFLWKEGAILTDQGIGIYIPVEDIWNKVNLQSEFISAYIIEHPEMEDYFERVYADTIIGNLYRTKDKLIKKYEDLYC